MVVELHADWLACSPIAVAFFPPLAELPNDRLRPSEVYPSRLALAFLAVAVVVECAAYLHPLLPSSKMQNLECQPSCHRHIVRHVSDKMRQKGLDRKYAITKEHNFNMLKWIIIFYT